MRPVAIASALSAAALALAACGPSQPGGPDREAAASQALEPLPAEAIPEEEPVPPEAAPPADPAPTR